MLQIYQHDEEFLALVRKKGGRDVSCTACAFGTQLWLPQAAASKMK